MGKGAGKGGALLGKNVKGKSSEKRSKPKIGENVTESELKEDIKMLEEYEKLNRLAEAQRARLKKLQQQETYNTRINKKLLVNIHRKFMRADKVDQLRKEVRANAQHKNPHSAFTFCGHHPHNVKNQPDTHPHAHPRAD
jgi:hypothetical protein